MPDQPTSSAPFSALASRGGRAAALPAPPPRPAAAPPSAPTAVEPAPAPAAAAETAAGAVAGGGVEAPRRLEAVPNPQPPVAPAPPLAPLPAPVQVSGPSPLQLAMREAAQRQIRLEVLTTDPAQACEAAGLLRNEAPTRQLNTYLTHEVNERVNAVCKARGLRKADLTEALFRAWLIGLGESL